MADSQTVERIRCPKCGCLNRLTYIVAEIGRANRNEQTGRCAKPACGTVLARNTCLSIWTELIESTPEAA